MLTDGRTDGRTTDGRTTDGRTTDAGVTGILIAHLGAFGSGELKINAFVNNTATQIIEQSIYNNTLIITGMKLHKQSWRFCIWRLKNHMNTQKIYLLSG